MSILTAKELLMDAKARHYAVAAFNTNNLEYTQAILEAAAEMKSPVIVEAAKSEIDYMNGFTFVAMVRTLAEKLPINVAIHLDHGPSYEEGIRCINYGFTSIMYDGSRLSLGENIATTQKIVEAAHACGISVEGEIGVIGQAADGPEGPRGESDALASPVDCERFVKETGVDFFAAAIGNAHGLYTKKPKLDFERLSDIEKRTRVPLVLHGGTGIPVEDIKRAISLGVAKINFSTIMRQAYIETLRKTLAANPGDLDLMKMLTPSKLAMKAVAKEHILMCGSDGKS
jgi:fructose-bisphosphate aldolase class II